MPNILPPYSYPLFGKTNLVATGINQASAAGITTTYTNVTGGTAPTSATVTGGVVLPVLNAQQIPQNYVVNNFTPFAVNVFPALTDAIVGVGYIQGTSNSNPYVLPGWTGVTFQGVSNNPLQWNVEEPYTIPTGTVPT
jgi:hypothetical protein